jgi:hypothetical protein
MLSSSPCVLFAAAIAFPGIAAAQSDLGSVPPDTVLTSATAQQIATLLQSKGYRATISVGTDNAPIVNSATGGVNFDIFLFNCDTAKAKRCEKIEFIASFTTEQPTALDVLNKFNADWVDAKGYLTTDGYSNLSYSVMLTGGVTVANLGETLGLWDSVVNNFTKAIGW